MRKKIFLLHILLLIGYCSFSQGVGIGTATPDPSAALDIRATAKGLLVPRMTSTAMNAIANPARGLMVFDSSTAQLKINTGTSAIPNWQPVSSNGGNGWNLTGNSGSNPANQFIGNTDNQPLRFRVNNIRAGELHPVTGNIFWGLRAGQANTNGFSNIAIGTDAMKLNTVFSNTVAIGDSALFSDSASFNAAIGSKALLSNTTGAANTAIGFESLRSNTIGQTNTATGAQSLFANTTGNNNTANGTQSLLQNTTGRDNTAVGFESLFSNTGGVLNVANGSLSLSSNTTGSFNTAAGYRSLASNTIGRENTAIGSESLLANSSGNFNSATGNLTLANNQSGSNNVAFGDEALSAIITGSGNTAIGSNANTSFTDLSNTVALGFKAMCTASNQVRFGNSTTISIGGIVGFTNLSDGRYKKNIQEKVKGLDFIMKLRPVTYQLNIAALEQKLHPEAAERTTAKDSTNENSKTIFSGFIAQEVEQAGKELGYDFSGVDKPKNDSDMYGLRYAEFVVPLTKAVQEQQQMISLLKKQNEEQKLLNENLLKRISTIEAALKK